MTKKQTPKANKILPLVIILCVLTTGVLIGIASFIPNYPTWQEQNKLQNEVNTYVGLTPEQAKKRAAKNGIKYLQINEGEEVLLQGKFVPNRLIVKIKNNKVVHAELSGEQDTEH